MNKRILLILCFLTAFLFISGVMRYQQNEAISGTGHSTAGIQLNELPRKGTVTMLDLGADYCIPCKMMAPVLSKLKKEYQGRAEIIFIDVNKHPEQASRFKVRAIPTQIFFDKEGKEVDRHVGFLKEEAIIAKLKYLGVD